MRQPCRITIVDESFPLAESLAVVLRRQGYEVNVSQSADDAMRTMRNTASHAVLCDVAHGDLNAVDLAARVRQAWPACKFVFLGPAEELSAMLQKSRKRGQPAYAHTKPIYPAALLSKLDLMLGRT